MMYSRVEVHDSKINPVATASMLEIPTNPLRFTKAGVASL